MSDEVVIALITAVGLVAAASIPILVKWVIDRATTRMMARNTSEHLINKSALDDIRSTLDGHGKTLVAMDEKVDEVIEGQIAHLTWHLNQRNGSAA